MQSIFVYFLSVHGQQLRKYRGDSEKKVTLAYSGKNVQHLFLKFQTSPECCSWTDGRTDLRTTPKLYPCTCSGEKKNNAVRVDIALSVHFFSVILWYCNAPDNYLFYLLSSLFCSCFSLLLSKGVLVVIHVKGTNCLFLFNYCCTKINRTTGS